MKRLIGLVWGSVAISSMLTTVALAGAPDATVSIASDGPHPRGVKISLGDSVSWTNDDAIAHRIRSNPAGFFSTHRLDPGESSRDIPFLSSGTFAYDVLRDPGERGFVRVPVRLRPGENASPTPGAVIRIRVATERRHGRTYDVQRKLEDGRWITIAEDTRRTVARFRPRTTGSFSFRARVTISRLGITSGWSPPEDKLVVPAP